MPNRNHEVLQFNREEEAINQTERGVRVGKKDNLGWRPRRFRQERKNHANGPKLTNIVSVEPQWIG